MNMLENIIIYKNYKKLTIMNTNQLNTNHYPIDTSTLQLPENISQFGQPGYYPEIMLNGLLDNYCIYCGDLLCPCEQYMNEDAKRSSAQSANNNSTTTNININEGQPDVKRGKNCEY